MSMGLGLIGAEPRTSDLNLPNCTVGSQSQNLPTTYVKSENLCFSSNITEGQSRNLESESWV